ncbi:hypothetical protein FSARC_11950 [Fusarium sarcochroum]|uniref:DUF7587 domain-containing protein n=1 Tax=Fusarium sarcochroum TaxID=1208366 RepID=A0A8H4TBV9_9HYPO|nr:hypothetical protein FSARC_11950 [Fusarium sarcochroum]
MDRNAMKGRLESLSITGSESLPFQPTDYAESWHKLFDGVPRYLFRVFATKSQGTTDCCWSRFRNAKNLVDNSSVDIFARPNKKETAGMISRHLLWLQGSDDNLVSWTSSLLYALVYIFYLHANKKDDSAFEDTYLCVVDT